MAEKRKAVAKHGLVDENGAVTEMEETAHGITYDLVNGQGSFQWNWSEATDDERRMLACFGAKTLATNVSSQSRTAGRDGEQIDDINARFALIRAGTWADRTREAFKPDLDLLVAAFAENAVKLGKVTQEQVDTAKKAEWRQKAEENDQWVKDVYSISAVKDIYARLAGKPIKTVDDLL